MHMMQRNQLCEAFLERIERRFVHQRTVGTLCARIPLTQQLACLERGKK